MDSKKKAPDDRVKEQSATYETYAAMPDDGNRYEVIGGRLELMPSPSPNHQLIGSELAFRLRLDCNISDKLPCVSFTLADIFKEVLH